MSRHRAPRSSGRAPVVVALVAAPLLLSACGSGGSAADADGPTPSPSTATTAAVDVCPCVVTVVAAQPGWGDAKQGDPAWSMGGSPNGPGGPCVVQATGGRRMTLTLSDPGSTPATTVAAVCLSLRQAFPGDYSEVGDTTCHLEPSEQGAFSAASVTVIGSHLMTLTVADPADSTALASAFLSAVSFGLEGQLG